MYYLNDAGHLMMVAIRRIDRKREKREHNQMLDDVGCTKKIEIKEERKK